MQLPNLAKIYKEAGMEAYKESIISFVESLNDALRKDLGKYGKELELVDFRIPQHYRKSGYVSSLILSLLERGLNTSIYSHSLFNREDMQDLRNIAVVSFLYCSSVKERVIIPREKKEGIKILSLWKLIKNLPKLTQKYWDDKPLTDLEIVVDKDVDNYLHSIFYHRSFTEVVKGLYSLRLKYEDLPFSLRDVVERYINVRGIYRL